MSKREAKGKLIRPTFFVFCEGKTEAAYVKYLRATYRLPIEIDPKIAGSDISSEYIKEYKKHKTVPEIDKTFLLYDGDKEEVLQNVKRIQEVTLLCSNPCIEIWYLLHCQNQTGSLNDPDCQSKLKRHIRTYKKGFLDANLIKRLSDNKCIAISRAKNLPKFSNPSTNVYDLLEALEAIKKNDD